jgi:flavin reductase (DIM6/NTAB) family NADH-FMN oxidoreductase RutF
VAVITALYEGQLVGMAVNSFAAVSLSPPLVLWSIRIESSSAAAFLNANHFAINVLSAEQVEVSQLFGAAHPDRFANVRWQPGRGGAPLLDGAIGQLECRREMTHAGGDHWIIVGHVEHYARFAGEPLLFAQGQYAVARDHPRLPVAAPAAVAVAPTRPPASIQEPSFMRLLTAASSRMSTLFQAHREDLGITPAGARLLSRLLAGAYEREELERVTFLGRLAVDDALADLEAGGLVQCCDAGRLELTPQGRGKSEALAQRAAVFNASMLHVLADADVAAARRVLAELMER